MPSATGRSSIILVVTVGRWLCVTLKQREHQCTIQKCFLYFLLFWVACRIRSASYFSRFFFLYFISILFVLPFASYVRLDFGRLRCVCVCVWVRRSICLLCCCFTSAASYPACTGPFVSRSMSAISYRYHDLFIQL